MVKIRSVEDRWMRNSEWKERQFMGCHQWAIVFIMVKQWAIIFTISLKIFKKTHDKICKDHQRKVQRTGSHLLSTV
jgi:hypothetical protein